MFLLFSPLPLLFFASQLKDTKSADQKSTLLNFLAETCEEKFPEALKFVEDLQHVDRASRGTETHAQVNQNYSVSLAFLLNFYLFNLFLHLTPCTCQCLIFPVGLTKGEFRACKYYSTRTHSRQDEAQRSNYIRCVFNFDKRNGFQNSPPPSSP